MAVLTGSQSEGCICLRPLQADSVFDVIPGDVCSSIVIAACAATSQVCPHLIRHITVKNHAVSC